jgi:hypothetical protein
VKHGETRGNESVWQGRRAERAAEWHWDSGSEAADGRNQSLVFLRDRRISRFFFQDWLEGKSFDVPVIDVLVIVSQN